MITKEQLEEWMFENGEDVLVDGPFEFSEKQMNDFVEIIKGKKKIIKHLHKEGCIDKHDLDDMDFENLGVGSTDKSSRLILKEFVLFLNQEGFTL